MRRLGYAALAVVVAAVTIVVTTTAFAENRRAEIPSGDHSVPSFTQRAARIAAETIVFELDEGESAQITAGMRLTGATSRVLVRAELECRAPSGETAGGLTRSQNVYREGTGPKSTVSLPVRYMFTATEDGGHRCELTGWARSQGAAGEMTVSGGFLELTGRHPGAVIGTTDKSSLVSDADVVLEPDIEADESVPGQDGLWRAPRGTTSLSVNADTQLTTCYGRDERPCPTTLNDGVGSHVRSYLVTVQYAKDGSVCNMSSVSVDTHIAQYVHHRSIYLSDAEVPVVTGRGCLPLFSVHSKHEWRDGHPFFVHGPESTGIVYVVPS